MVDNFFAVSHYKLGLWILLEKTPLGKAIYLIGSNERATLYSGINTRRVLIWVFIAYRMCSNVAIVR